VAVREYLIREMAAIEAFQKAQQPDKTGLDLRNYNTLRENTNIFQSSQL